jgi:cytochrome bd-type quinol oxidase subunit 1
MMDLLKNIIGIIMNLSMTLGFIMMLYIMRAIQLIKKDEKVLDFIKKNS